jgi:hypothetical protein
MIESGDTSFGGEARRRLLEDFVVSYYNGSLKPNLAERNMATGRDIEFLMDAPQFEKIRKPEIWSDANAVGTGYQFRVVYKDRRFSDLEHLVAVYSGTLPAPDEDRAVVEQSLYQLILLLIKEGRLPKTFKIQSAKEAQEEKVDSMVEELARSVEELGLRVRKLEEQLAAKEAPTVQSQQQTVS